MRTYFWPCRVACSATGEWSVQPLEAPHCSGTGGTRAEAIEAARTALTHHVQVAQREFLIPPMVFLEPKEMQLGQVVRLEISIDD